MGGITILKRKAIILLLLFLFFTPFISIDTVAAGENPIQIFIENERQVFDTAPVIEQGRVLVPFRGVFESLQAEVNWNQSEQKVTLTKDQITVSLKINDTVAFKNGDLLSLDVPAKIINSRTYVPLRFAAKAIGAEVNWDGENRAVFICLLTCGDQLPPPSLSSEQKDTNVITVNNFSIGDSLKKVTDAIGKPKEIVVSQYGFDWYIYHEGYRDYLQIGISNGKIVAFYTNNDLFNIDQEISLNMTKQKVRSILGQPITSIIKGNVNYQFREDGEWDLFLVNELYYVTVFYDIYENNNVTAIQVIQKQFEYSLEGYYGVSSGALRTSYEKQMFHLVNAIRVRKGLEALTWNDLVADVARDHSDDMAKNDYFNHTSLDGRSPFDRMSDAGLVYRTAGENLATGQFSAIFAHEGLMNSYGHRKNIVNSRFEQIGVGVSFQNHSPYFTENYFTD